jgi:hypothetical protein
MNNGVNGVWILQTGVHAGTGLLDGPQCVVYPSLYQYEEEINTAWRGLKIIRNFPKNLKTVSKINY